jgi:hypothetical protein
MDSWSPWRRGWRTGIITHTWDEDDGDMSAFVDRQYYSLTSHAKCRIYSPAIPENASRN